MVKCTWIWVRNWDFDWIFNVFNMWNMNGFHMWHWNWNLIQINSFKFREFIRKKKP